MFEFFSKKFSGIFIGTIFINNLKTLQPYLCILNLAAD